MVKAFLNDVINTRYIFVICICLLNGFLQLLELKFFRLFDEHRKFISADKLRNRRLWCSKLPQREYEDQDWLVSTKTAKCSQDD
jgi:hypothetical protein